MIFMYYLCCQMGNRSGWQNPTHSLLLILIQNMNWRLIVIEGVDATWKTTLAKWLARLIWGAYYKTPWTKTQGERAYYDQEEVSVEERFLFYLDACREDISRIMDIQSSGSHVVCDRLLSSTITHHQAMKESLDVSDAEILDAQTPRIQILLQASRWVIHRRLTERWALTRLEKDESLLMRVQDLFSKGNNNLIIQTDAYNIPAVLKIAHKFIINNL